MDFPFSSLPPDLQLLVVEQCSSGDLLRLGMFPTSLLTASLTKPHLAQASSGYHTLVLPLLYRHVDISVHNVSGLFPSNHHDCIVDAANPDCYLSPDVFSQLESRQEAFIDAVIRMPSRGSMVLSLTWTYQCYAERCMETDERQQRTWTAFKLLNRVQKLDMCSLDRERFHVVPPLLFPAATSIRIGGCMSYAFFRAMISSPEIVVSLDLDNAQGLGQVQDGLDEEWEVPLSSSPDNILLHQETEDDREIPVLRHPGAMRGHLNPLIGHFLNLKHLCIRTVGQDDSTDQSWSDSREKERYTEISNFLRSVRSTLTTLVFEQGNQPEVHLVRSCRGDPRRLAVQKGRPMDTYFLSYVLHTLIQGPWPELKMLSIRGVGAQPREWNSYSNVGFRNWVPIDPSIVESAQNRLRTALENTTRLLWEPEVDRCFYLESGNDYSDPHAPFVPY
jgi:hypothetical protein